MASILHRAVANGFASASPTNVPCFALARVDVAVAGLANIPWAARNSDVIVAV